MSWGLRVAVAIWWLAVECFGAGAVVTPPYRPLGFVLVVAAGVMLYRTCRISAELTSDVLSVRSWFRTFEIPTEQIDRFDDDVYDGLAGGWQLPMLRVQLVAVKTDGRRIRIPPVVFRGRSGELLRYIDVLNPFLHEQRPG